MDEKKSTFPGPQAGNVAFEGREALQFWVRAFQLEGEIETVRKIIEAKPERKRAVVPLIAEYALGERLKFIYLLKIDVDALGIRDGLGLVYWASPEYEERVYKKRDGYADLILKRLAGDRKFDEVLEVETKKEE
jgi:hypothetical protein